MTTSKLEVITGRERPREKSTIFELLLNNKHVFYGDSKAIGDYLGVNPSAVKHNRNVDDHYTRRIGLLEYEYYYKGRAATREKHAQLHNIRKDKVSELVSSSFSTSKAYVNGLTARLVHLDDYMESIKPNKLVQQIHKFEQVAPKIIYKGENKAYVDSLFDNCFRGWNV